MVFTGHSLGGALATLAVADALGMIFDPGYLKKSLNVSHITFGSPRALDPELAEALSVSNISHFRVTNRNDIVPHLPSRGLLNKYMHISNQIWLNEAGEAMLCNDSPTKEDTNCANSYKFSKLKTKPHTDNWWGLGFGGKYCPLIQ